MERIQKQIKDTYHKAFFDLLEQKVHEEPPDYDWISKLYLEIRIKLTKLLKSSSTLRIEIEEKMDPTIFNQMMRNNAFNGTDLFNLISYVFDKIRCSCPAPQLKAESPASGQSLFPLLIA